MNGKKSYYNLINIKNKDLKMAKYLITQFGGPNGESDINIKNKEVISLRDSFFYF